MKHVYKIIPATEEHIDYIAPAMRHADRDEVYATSRQTPCGALLRSLEKSTLAWTGTVDDDPICMFGVGAESLLSSAGSPWLLGTEKMMKHQLPFLRRCRPVVARMLDIYPVLVNWVDARNTASIRWLKWLGFNLEEAAPFGALGLPFHRFSMSKENV